MMPGLSAREDGSTGPTMINQLDRNALRQKFREAKPFPYIVIENFLEPKAAEEVALAYPSFEQARAQGFSFNMLNEQRKVQVVDCTKFPTIVQRLNEAISSPQFLADLQFITGIPQLLVDETLSGGGMHLTGSGGRLDVHVDFNIVGEKKLFRRLNLLLYLNPVWQESWGGRIELWDRDVKECLASCAPVLNRCLIFETSEISFHGVTPISAPPEVVRQSFAAYYYTSEPPPNWTGVSHSTIFKARPDERFRALVLMPWQKLVSGITNNFNKSKRAMKAFLLRP
jgi:Rps23 Pro-64 3,4-dihydroxylase Tpa1-like proline 4-hydroxylase